MEKKYIIYGAGVNGIKALKLLGEKNVVCFCDKNKKGTMNNVPIITVEELKNRCMDDATVIITPDRKEYVLEMSWLLGRYGIKVYTLEQVAAEIVREEAIQYDRMNQRKSFEYSRNREHIFPLDRFNEAGDIGSYFWQDLWAAQKVHESLPLMHYDIGSRIDGFIAHLLSFGQRVKQIDIRPLDSYIEGFDFYQADATELNGIADNSIESLSALCSLEHFGLGRYGDTIDPEACFKCFSAIQSKIKEGGKLYISVPIGMEHLEFNAHRVFYAKTIVECFDKMKLIEFSCCHNEEYEVNVDIHKYDNDDEFGGTRFGLFMFQKNDWGR